MSGARKTALIAAGLFLLNVAINAPFFLPGEHKYRDSIEGGYASMAKFISEHPNPFGWNPLQYKGLPTHDWYLPLLPYTSAIAINILPFLKPEHVYRLIVVTIVCFGPVTMFLFMLEFTRTRRWSLAAALLYMFFSMGYLLFPAIKAGSGTHLRAMANPGARQVRRRPAQRGPRADSPRPDRLLARRQRTQVLATCPRRGGPRRRDAYQLDRRHRARLVLPHALARRPGLQL
jgi:hypothetical protein